MLQMSPKICLSLLMSLTMVLLLPSLVLAYEREAKRPAIVLAAFGTTDVEALEAILNVEKKVQAAFPDYDVHLAFTSNIIRDIWHKRADNAEFIRDNPGLDRLYRIANPLTTMARIQEEGSRTILVQSLHITNGSEFDDQKSIVDQLAGIKAHQESKKPFPYLVIGDSALGDGSPANLDRAARALSSLVELARAEDSALVLMGHGNEHLDVKSYRDFAAAMNKMYNYPIFLGLVEGWPDFEAVLADLKEAEAKKVFLAPFMLVAGDHAKNDMAGDEEDSWASQLKSAGLGVKSHVKGLGQTEAWADIYVERLKALEAEFKKQAAQ